jgi:hypothetical protein
VALYLVIVLLLMVSFVKFSLPVAWSFGFLNFLI